MPKKIDPEARKAKRRERFNEQQDQRRARFEERLTADKNRFEERLDKLGSKK